MPECHLRPSTSVNRFAARRSLVVSLFVVLFVNFLCVQQAVSQTSGTAALAGTVTDSSGAGIPRAEVVVKNKSTGESGLLKQTAMAAIPALFFRPEIIASDSPTRASGSQFLLGCTSI
jgi:hypothetical protein